MYFHTCVLQVADGIYQHVDVREEGKENAFSLGHTLWINTEVSCVLFPASRGATSNVKALQRQTFPNCLVFFMYEYVLYSF